MAAKLPAIRFLQQRRVPHELFTFDTRIRTAREVALETGMPLEAVYKTLVVEEDPPRGKPSLFLVPADSEVDLKRLAKVLHLKKARMASQRDAEWHTGLQVGGISALALTAKGFPVYIDSRALALEWILVSAGQRGADIRLAAADLVRAVNAVAVEGCTRRIAEP